MTIMTIAQVNGNIKTIATRGQNLDALIQQTALSILVHVANNKEASLAGKLYNKMPKGSRRLALAHWFCKFGTIRVNPTKDKADSEARPFLFDGDKDLDLTGAEAMQWFDAKKEKALRDEFNFDIAMVNFKKVLDRAIKAGKLDAKQVEVQQVLNLGASAADRIEAEVKAMKKNIITA